MSTKVLSVERMLQRIAANAPDVRTAWYRMAGVPAKFDPMTASTGPKHRMYQDAVHLIGQWLSQNLERPTLGRPVWLSDPGLVLVGPSGVGKSVLAAEAMTDLMARVARKAPSAPLLLAMSRALHHGNYAPTYVCAFLHWPTVIMALRGDTPEDQKILARVRTVTRTADVVVYDDFGVGDYTPAREALMLAVLQRLDRLAPTIVTCNTPVPQWDAVFGDRVSRRLTAATVRLVLCDGWGPL